MKNAGKLSIALLASASLLAGLYAAPAASAAGPGASAAKKKGKGRKGKRKPKPIVGTLSNRGYTVIALAKSGRATTRRVKRRRFTLRPPAGKVTLHLRAPNGTYAGPVVLRGRSRKAKRSAGGGKRAIVGVKAGARLGRVKVKRRAGYALASGVARRWMDAKVSATARKGVPIGADNFGRVRVRKLRGRQPDRDLDGIPRALDIDDDGDLILDDVDPNDAKTGARAKSSATLQEAENLGAVGAFSSLLLGGEALETPGFSPVATPPAVVNANAPGLSEEQIQSGLRDAEVLQIYGEDDLGTMELNCGALVYCSRGGTGRRDLHLPNGLTLDPERFPECCDPDGDGFGALERGGVTANDFDLFIQTHAGADQIHGGDLLIGQVTVPPLSKDTPGKFEPYAGQEVELPFTLKTIFATAPAIASYTDELGATHAVSYPSSSAALPVVDGPDPGSDVSVTLNLWRPQRRPVPGELPPGTGNWVDIGGLQYWVNAGPLNCPQSAFSATGSGVGLTTVARQSPAGPEQVALLLDSAPDRVASPGNTFGYTLNITSCLAAAGNPANLENFSSGSGPVQLRFLASPVPAEGQPPAEQLVGSTFLFSNQP